MIFFIFFLKFFFVVDSEKISSCFSQGSCEISHYYRLMVCTDLKISLFFNVTTRCLSNVYLISKINFKAYDQILNNHSLYKTIQFFKDTNQYQASIDFTFIEGIDVNLFQIDSTDKYFVQIGLNRIKFKVFENNLCSRGLIEKKRVRINQLIIGKGIKYSEKVCPLVFSNILIDYLSIKYLSNTFFKKNYIRFKSIEKSIELNSVIKTLEFFLAENIFLTSEILNPVLFKFTESIYLFGKIKLTQKNLFSFFPHLRFIQIDMFYARSLFQSGLGWLTWLNRDLNVNMSNHSSFNLHKNRTVHVNIAYSSNQQSYDLLTVNEVFPEEDFCIYLNLPFSQMVLLSVNDRIQKEYTYEYTCTFKWIAKHYFDFKMTEIPSYYDFSWELDYGRFDNFSTNQCDFDSHIKRCQASQFSVQKEKFTLYDLKILIVYFDDLFSVILIPFLSIIVLIVSVITFMIFRKLNEKHSIKKCQFNLVKSHSILSAIYSVISIFSLISNCSMVNGFFCSKVHTSLLAQYYQIVLVDFGQSVVKFGINSTILSFIVCRLLLIEKNTSLLLSKIFNVPFKKLISITFLFGILLSVSGLFIHKTNKFNKNADYPAFFLIDNFNLHQSIEDLLKSMILMKNFFNSIFFILVNFIIDTILIFKIRAAFKQSNLLRQKMNMRMNSKQSINSRIIYLTVFITTLNLILKLSEVFSPIYFFLQYYGLINLITIHNRFQFFLQVICDRLKFNILMNDFAQLCFIISNICNFYYYFVSDKQLKKIYMKNSLFSKI